MNAQYGLGKRLAAVAGLVAAAALLVPASAAGANVAGVIVHDSTAYPPGPGVAGVIMPDVSAFPPGPTATGVIIHDSTAYPPGPTAVGPDI